MTRVEAMREATIALVQLDRELAKREAIRDDMTLPEITRLKASAYAEIAREKIKGWEARKRAVESGAPVEGVE